MNKTIILSSFALLSAFLTLLLGSFVFLQGKSSRVNRNFFIFTLTIFIWLLFYSFAYFVKAPVLKFLFFRIGYIGVICIPITWYHFELSFLRKDNKKLFFLLYGGYTIAAIFIFLDIFTKSFIIDLSKYNWGYYPKVFIPIHLSFLSYFNFYFTIALLLLFFSFWKKNNIPPIERARIKYIFIAGIVGTFAAIDFLPNYEINYKLNIIPFGFTFMIIFCGITTYAIIRYRLMDIRVFISRALAFLISYSILLIVPFFFAFRMYPVLGPLFGIHWWLVPVGLLMFFAALAPMAYEQIRRGMENTLLAAQKRYQKLLLQAAAGMVREHNLSHLSKLIVYIVKKIVKVDFASIFLNDKTQRVYTLRAIRDHAGSYPKITFLYEHPFIDYLRNNQEPVLYEELPLAIRNSLGVTLPISLIIPSAFENNLLGFVILGEKLNREPYSEDDINTFKTLSHQAAMAIENCLFFEEFKNVQRKIFTAEKLASIGGMADGVAHQIKNRLNHFSIGSGEMQCEIKDFIKKHPAAVEQNPELMKSFEYILGIIDSMIDNVKRTDNVVKGILGYARVEEKAEFFSEFPLNEILQTSLDLLKIKHEVAEVPLKCDFGSDDTLYGVKAQLMECMFNILDNTYEATMEKRNKLPDEEKLQFNPLIEFKLTQAPGISRIQITDNGVGIKDEDKLKIFAPFFTTKSSYKSGSGIGMYVVRRIVEENHKGKITFESAYMQGTKFVIELPRK